MTDHELARRLDTLILDEPPPGSPWHDLARGRAARRRRTINAVAGTLLTAGLTTAVLVALAPGATPDQSVPDVGSDPTVPLHRPSEPTSYAAPDELPPTTTPEYVPEQVSATEAVARCLAGVRVEVPTADADPDALAGGPFYAGDRVEIPLLPNESDYAGCDVVAGPLDPPTSWTLPIGTVASDTEAILDTCSSRLRIDLAEWTVAAAMTDGYGGLASTLVSPRQGYVVRCQLQESLMLNGYSDVRIENHTSLQDIHAMALDEQISTWPALEVFSGGSSCYPSFDDCQVESVSRSGVLPRGMESASVILADGTEVPVPVGPFGTFAIRLTWPAGPDPQIMTFDAAGDEVGSWPVRS